MKVKFESDDDLPLGKILRNPVCIIAAGSVKKTRKQQLFISSFT